MSMQSKKINIGVVGATGVVGETFLALIDERAFPAEEIRLFASEASIGLTRKCVGKEWPVQTLTEGCFNGLDLVFFSSGEDISEKWAPKAVEAGAFAVDNSSAFRMNDKFPLVVPEVNGDLLDLLSGAASASAPSAASVGASSAARKPTIIANPNCSTIQLVVALNPLQRKFGLKNVRVATYQSVSGAGRNGIEELFSATRIALEGDEMKPVTFVAPIAFNCIPQIGSFSDDGFTTEESKIMNESQKILRLPALPISAFTVRVPTMNSHAEVAWVTLNSDSITQSQIEEALREQDGLELGSPKQGQSPAYPLQTSVSGRDPVYVGRVHRDRADKATWLMWIVSDNLRKGAALNGIQIAERIFDLT
jgi:aspartate-semialdehyde dehydrogenase